MQTLYTSVKVNNEIELCAVSEPECKKLIEKSLLENRISYYIRWPKASLFSCKKNQCIICINDNSKEAAEEIVRSICDESGYSVKFLLRKSNNNFL